MYSLSIIIPVYNAGKYLKKCLKSIENQSYQDYEVILVNDGSSDNSVQICEEFQAMDPRFTLINKENGGVSSARNMGIEHANGEWLYFVDADDELLPDCLSILINHTNKDPELIMCGYNYCNEEGDIIEERKKCIKEHLTIKETIKELYNPSEKRYQGFLWCKLLKKSIVNKYNIHFNEQLYFNEDRLFLIQYLCKCTKDVIYDNIPIYNYYEHNDGAMHSLCKGYNLKYVTDFDAYILMKKEIEGISDDTELLWLSMQGIRKSFEYNEELMYEHHQYSNAHWHMIKGMIHNGLLVPYIKDKLRPLIMLIWPGFYCKKI
ncbi:MAG: glycosyltransferase family 2 protein [Prevotella sp.]|nr:glycosyltransferase family 2 protein [Prevotella sp.]